MKKEMSETILNTIVLVGILAVLFVVGLAYAEEGPTKEQYELAYHKQVLETLKIAFEKNALALEFNRRQIRECERNITDLEKSQSELQLKATETNNVIINLEQDTAKGVAPLTDSTVSAPVVGEEPSPHMDNLEDAE
jgi:Tfp pilus assembly protein PilO